MTTMSSPTPGPLYLQVRRRFDASTSVAAFELVSSDGRALPPWTPGAHIDVHLPNGIRRQYSLCGPIDDRTFYRIGVLREPTGRGGSAWIHEHLREGDTLEAMGPRNHFELEPAASYHFVAAGVGITPILPMVRAAETAGAEWQLTYLGRSRDTMAFLSELSTTDRRVRVHADDEHGRADLAAFLDDAGAHALTYACGPEGMLGALETVLAERAGSLRTERFAPQDRAALDEQGESFTVVAVDSDREIEVPSGVSILEALENAGLSPDYSCREGTCGTCEVAIRAGHADHRDSILGKTEREADESLMICVSRSRTPRLELEI